MKTGGEIKKSEIGQSFIADKEGIIEIYSGSEARSAEVKVGDTFVVTEKMQNDIYYLGKLKIKGSFKLNAGLSGKDITKMNYGNQDEVVYLLRKTNIDGESNFFAQFKKINKMKTGGELNQSTSQDKEDAMTLATGLGKGFTSKEFGEYIEDYFKNPTEYEIDVDSEYYDAIEAAWGQIADEARIPVWQKVTVEASPIFKEYSKMKNGGGVGNNEKIIGKTKSGKNIYSNANSKNHDSFSIQDHQDAKNANAKRMREVNKKEPHVFRDYSHKGDEILPVEKLFDYLIKYTNERKSEMWYSPVTIKRTIESGEIDNPKIQNLAKDYYDIRSEYYDAQRQISKHSYIQKKLKSKKEEMKNGGTVNDFDSNYWLQYNEKGYGYESPNYLYDKSKNFEDTFEEAIDEWNSIAESPEYKVKGKEKLYIKNTAKKFFEKEKFISISIIHAMIFQEAGSKMKTGGFITDKETSEKTIGTWLLNSPDGRKMIKKTKNSNELKNNAIEYLKKGDIIGSQYGNIFNKQINKNIDWEYIFKNTKYSYKMKTGGGVGKHIVNGFGTLKNGTRVYIGEGSQKYPNNDGVGVEGIYYDVTYQDGKEKLINSDEIVFPIKDKMKTGGSVDSYYEKMVKNNWENIAYTWETGGKKVPNSISSVDAEEFLNDLDSNFCTLNEKEQANAISKFKNAFKSVRVTKMGNGGLANTPESFPNNDAMSYKTGGVTWKVNDVSKAKHLGIIEFQDNEGEYHNFEVM